MIPRLSLGIVAFSTMEKAQHQIDEPRQFHGKSNRCSDYSFFKGIVTMGIGYMKLSWFPQLLGLFHGSPYMEIRLTRIKSWYVPIIACVSKEYKTIDFQFDLVLFKNINTTPMNMIQSYSVSILHWVTYVKSKILINY